METQQLGKFCDQFAIDKPTSGKPRKPVKDYTPYHKKKRFSKKKTEDKNQRNNDREDRKWDEKRLIICRKCGKKGHYAQTCWVKQKINNHKEDDRIKEIISKILLNSDESSGSEITNYSTTSEDIKVLNNENLISSSESECEACIQGQPCPDKEFNNTDEEQLYRVHAQFQDFKINMLSYKLAMELLEVIKDTELKLKIIEKLNTAP